MFEPVRACIEDDCSDACEDLWLFLIEIGTPTASSILKPFGYCDADVEDVVMEVVLRLFEDSHRRLRSFRGESQSELDAWVRIVVKNHARNWLVRNDEVLRGASFDFESLSTHTNPLGDELIRFLRTVERGANNLANPLTGRDTKRLRMLAGLEPLPGGISGRTVRRWKRSLRQQLEYSFLKD